MGNIFMTLNHLNAEFTDVLGEK